MSLVVPALGAGWVFSAIGWCWAPLLSARSRLFWILISFFLFVVEGLWLNSHFNHVPFWPPSARPSPEATPAPTPPGPASAPPSLPAPTPAPREFVDLDFEALAARTKTLNGIEAGRIYKVYVGKWIRVSGQIDDVTPAGNTGPIIVRFQAPTRNAGTVYMTFDRAKWEDRLGVVSRGDALTASCRIELVQPNGMSLSDCELE